MMVLVLVLITLVILLFLLSMIWPPDSPWSPWWRTSKETAAVMVKLAHIGKADVIYDLGCGDGTALITAATLVGAEGVGIEIDPLRVLIAKIQVQLRGVSNNVVIERKNFFAVSLSEASVVFLYLVPKALTKLKPKLLAELRPGTKIVTFVYKMDLPLIASDTKHEVYVYTIPPVQTTK